MGVFKEKLDFFGKNVIMCTLAAAYIWFVTIVTIVTFSAAGDDLKFYERSTVCLIAIVLFAKE